MRGFLSGFRSVVVVLLALLFLLPSGCSNDDECDIATSGGSSTTTGGVHANFPDGLHPDSTGINIIACVFAGKLTAVGSAESTVVVCLGDSITASGYPSLVASQTGMRVINEGRGGERSGSGLARLPGVLSRHSPNYVLILYGANDILNGGSVSGIMNNLRAMVNRVRSGGATPIVGTLTPLSGSHSQHQATVNSLNAQIRSSFGASVADVASRF